MTLYAIYGLLALIGLQFALCREYRWRWTKTIEELTDLQACYRDAIDSKLAVMRELEEVKRCKQQP